MKKSVLVAALLALPLLLGAEEYRFSFKSQFKNIPAKERSEDIFYKTAPALKLDGTNVGKIHNAVGRHFYLFKANARALCGKKLQLVMQLRRESGSAPLIIDYRIFGGKGGGYLAGKHVTIPLKEKGKWQQFVMDFSVPPLPDIENFNAGCSFLQDGKENNVVLVDEIEVREVKQTGMINQPEASLGTAALTMNTRPLILIQKGKPQFKIVLDEEADAIATYAAQEIQLHTKLITGTAPEIIRNDSYAGPAIFIGNNAMTRKFGIAPRMLPLENWVIARAGNAILISGGDTTSLFPNQVISRDTLPLGTLDAAYEFLERVFHIRWYWPGKLGTVAPQTAELAVEQLYETGTPAYDCRSLFFDISKGPDISPSEIVTWQRRNRLGGSAPNPIGMHAFRGWAEKYGATHPEYFALQPSGKRKTDEKSGTHLCLTNPGVAELAAKEAVDYFKENPTQLFFSIMPGDSNDLHFCRCPKCQATVSSHKGGPGIHSNAVWGFVNKVAALVAKSCPGKYIKCCAYADYTRRPDFPLMPNVAVTICYTVLPRGGNDYKLPWRELINEWWTTGARLYVWEYWLPRYKRGVYGAPAVYPRQLKEIYLMDRTQVSGRVVELCDINSQGVGLNGWGDWIYDSLNLYMGMRLMWDPAINVESELNAFFKNFYGPAGDTMKEFYNELEKAWVCGCWRQNDQNVWDWEICWRKVYPPAFVDRMMGLLRKAVAETAGKEPYHARAKKTLLGYLPFEQNSRMFQGVKDNKNKALNVPRGPAPKLDGKVEASEWKNAVKTGNFFDSFGVYEVKSSTEMYFLHDDSNLYAGIVAKYPEADSEINWYPAKLGRRDGFLWDYESAELFFAGKDKEYFQFIIAPDNAIFDSYFTGNVKDYLGNMKWNPVVEFATVRFKGGWSAEITIPLSALKLANAVAPNTFRSNFARNHRFFKNKDSQVWEQSMWLPSYGSFDNLERFGTLILK